MAIHTRPNDGRSVDWLTPPEIIRALPVFDLDPCAHPDQPNRTALVMMAPPVNGLGELWYGRVWLNPPYGRKLPAWMSKMADHGDGVALVPSRTEVESWFWPYVWEAAAAILFLRGRLRFHRPDGTIEGNAGHGSVLVAYGERNVDALRLSGIRGRLVTRFWEGST